MLWIAILFAFSALCTSGFALFLAVAHIQCLKQPNPYAHTVGCLAIIFTITKTIQFTPYATPDYMCHGLSVSASVLHAILMACILTLVNPIFQGAEHFVYLFAPAAIVTAPLAIFLNRIWYDEGKCLDKPMGSSAALVVIVLIGIYHVRRAVWKRTVLYSLLIIGTIVYGMLLNEEKASDVHEVYMAWILEQTFSCMVIAYVWSDQSTYRTRRTSAVSSRMSSMTTSTPGSL